MLKDVLDKRIDLLFSSRYACASNAPISEALRKYEAGSISTSRDISDSYAAPPLPAYLEKSLGHEEGLQDICFHLLRLYADRSHDLHVTLDPRTHTPNTLDHRLR